MLDLELQALALTAHQGHCPGNGEDLQKTKGEIDLLGELTATLETTFDETLYRL